MHLLPHRLLEFVGRRLAGRPYLQKVLSNTGWVLGERLLRHTVGFLIGVWIARYVGPHQYGLLSYALALVTIFAFLGALGLDGIAVRDLVRDPKERDTTLGTLLALRLGGGALMVGAAMMTALLAPVSEAAHVLVLLISLGYWLLAFDSIDCWFQANLTSRYTVAVKLVALVLAASLRVALILGEAPLVAFAWAMLFEFVVYAIGMMVAYRRSSERVCALRPSLTRARALLAEGWPLLVIAASGAIVQRMDQVMIGALSSYVDVGTYAVAVRVMEVTYILPTVLAASVFPAMLKSRAADPRLYELQMQKLYDIVIWLGFAIAVPLCLLAHVIVELLLGKPYIAAAPVLAILAWMPVVMFFALIRHRWLLAENAFRTAMAVDICTVALNILCNALLIPRYGATGAAMAALASSLAATVLVAPFSAPVRRSLSMFIRGLGAPLRWALAQR